MLNTTHSVMIVAACAASLLLSSCASVSVKEERFVVPKKSLEIPSQVFVRPFTFENGAINVSRKGEVLSQFKTFVSDQMAQTLAEQITKHIAPATVLKPDEPMRGSGAWLLEGRFTKLNQGSRMLRSLIGFGSGGTKMETTVSVFKIKTAQHKDLLGTFQTTGGSNAEPGAIFTGPIGFTPRLVMQLVKHGVSADIRRTARMITATLSEELSSAGAPLAGQPLRVKRLQASQ